MNEKLEAIVAEYLAAALEYGEASESGDYKRGNKCHDLIMRALRKLDSASAKGRELLLPLLGHQNPHVRGWAATHLLNSHPERALPVIEEIALLPGIVGIDARTLLREWQKGTLRVP